MIYTITTWVLPLLLTIILHEVAHGFVALQLGDTTAKRAGRLTLNPLTHIDILGTLVMPIVLIVAQAPVLFGWAKPVPVNFSALQNPKRDMGLVALAGPVSNFVLAILFVLLARVAVAVLPSESPILTWILLNVYNGVSLSLVIGIFNLFPVLPLDGGRILVSLLPEPYSSKYQETEQDGFLILMGLLFVLPMMGINVISLFVDTLLPFFQRMVNLFM